jgi:hypothetical protein
MKLLPILLLATAALLLGGCNDSTSPEKPAPMQTFTINNNTIYAHKQLVRLEVTPVSDGTALAKTFVCNYGEQVSPQVAIPAAGTYRVEVFTADSQSMWWDSVALALPGTTYVMITCGGGSIQFWGECAGLPPSGTTMAP